MKKAILIMAGGLLSLHFSTGQAQTQSEADLARILSELNVVQGLVNQADQHQQKNTRVQFRYDLLRQDLRKIQDGIEQALQRPVIEPHVITPIQGDYSAMAGVTHDS